MTGIFGGMVTFPFPAPAPFNSRKATPGETEPRGAPRAHGGRRRGGSGFIATACALAASIAVSSCAFAPSPIRTRDAPSDIRLQSLRQPVNPPEVLASDPQSAALSARRIAADLSQRLRARSSTEVVDGPRVPFFFESAIGRAYLAAGVLGVSGRALAQGFPHDRCPGFGAVLAEPEVQSASQKALSRCLADLPKTSASARDSQKAAPCACRLIAADELMLAPPETFVYARGVTAELRDERTGRRALKGAWASEGFRRGRRAGVARLRDENGAEILISLGYAPAELEERRAELAARARALAL